MRNVIFTSSDAKFGDFLINHWLVSLKANVSLKNTDVVILDYGLSERQVSELKKQKVTVVKCIRDGHVNILRFRDMASFLKNHKYSQVMVTDGGDIIFQEDISVLFDMYPDDFKAACEDLNISFEDFYLKNFFREDLQEKIKKTLKGHKMINCGVLIGPYLKFRKLCEESYSLILDRSKFGPDQVAVNYIFYREGFKSLDCGYNYVITTVASDFHIRDGVFYFSDSRKIPIVHNAGGISAFRPIKDFGYGTGHNKVKVFTMIFLRRLYRVINLCKSLLRG